jgi:hypothetical protein
MSGPSASSSMVPSAFTSASAAVSAPERPVYFPAGSIQDLIVIALGIPDHLIDRKKGGDMRVAYAKYLAVLDALDNLSLMSGSGTWKHPNTHDDVIEVFVSKSVYFRNHAKVFPLLVHYPAMKEWFEKTADTVEADRATADAVVWGSEKHSFDSLRKILTAHQNASTVKGKEKRKGKGKEVKRDGSSPPIPVEKKTSNKKDKRKEVIHNKKASSSKGRHGHD